jgi:RNA polymerase sigma-70 factor (ECF subfamily)
MQVQETTRAKMATLADGLLVKHILAGEKEVFEFLVHRYHVPIFRFISNMLLDIELASDITQHVFLQLYLSLPTLRTSNPLRAWLFQVARNRCLDELRKKKILNFSDLESGTEEQELSPVALIADPHPLPEEIAERNDLRQCLLGAIANLPLKYRLVVSLRYTTQLSFKEIGQTLQMPEATAKTYFQRARPLLRVALAEQRNA